MMLISLKHVFVITFVLLKTVSISAQLIEDSDGRQYLYESRQQYNWFQALHACNNHSGELLTINSAKEKGRIINLLKERPQPTQPVWLGAHDGYNTKINYHRDWWSVRGQKLNFFTWSKVDPDNNLNKEHCMAMSGSAANYVYGDNPCDFKRGYMCEIYSELFKKIGDHHDDKDLKCEDSGTKKLGTKGSGWDLWSLWQQFLKILFK